MADDSFEHSDPTFVSINSDSNDDWGTIDVEDISLETTTGDGGRIVHPDDFEIEFSCEFAIDADVTTCPHCGAANTIADPSWLFVFDADPDCSTCGFPLGVVR